MDLTLTEKDFDSEQFLYLNRCINYGKLFFDEVVHDVETRRVLIPIVRFPLVSRKLLGIFPYNKRLYDQPVSSMIVVEDFEHLSIEDHTKEFYTLDHVPILFGFLATNGELYLCSGSEIRGVTEWSITIKFKNIKIALTDETGVC